MIVPDVNLLLYTYDSDSPFHAKAVQWWGKYLSGAEAVGLPMVVVFGFLRIATNGRVFQNPMTTSEAVQHVRSWLTRPVVQIIEARSNHVEQVCQLLETLGTAGNLVTDTQIAALAFEYGAVVHTADTDFLRFPRLQWFNPITGAGSRRISGS
jgi:uncharacterized protein